MTDQLLKIIKDHLENHDHAIELIIEKLKQKKAEESAQNTELAAELAKVKGQLSALLAIRGVDDPLSGLAENATEDQIKQAIIQKVSQLPGEEEWTGDHLINPALLEELGSL